MRPYLALVANDLRLALRDRTVIFFNYLFPLVFFFGLGSMLHADRAVGTATIVVTSVLVICVLGNGLFGAGIRSAMDREAGILRRFKVTPITPVPLLMASVVTGWLLYVPNLVLMLSLAHVFWGLPFPPRPISLFVLLSVGVMAFRAIGLIVAAVANSVAESNILVQVLYMPMLFASGATFPITALPAWAQTFASFLPAFYLVSGIQAIFQRGEPLSDNLAPIAALLMTMAVAIFIARHLFRWDKEQAIAPASKLWVAAILAPFVVLGVNETRTHSQRTRSQAIFREVQRQGTFLIRNARIIAGDGRVIDAGGVLVRNGKIEEVYDGDVPDPEGLKAETVEAAGKTVLPGLIDVHVHLSVPGGVYPNPADYQSPDAMARALAQYLYAGVTAVKSVGDPLDQSIVNRDRIARGERLGAELFVSGPMFTAPGGHGTEYTQYLPANMRTSFEAQIVRTPTTADEARRAVRDLKQAGVDGLKAILETGFGAGQLFDRLDSGVLRAIGEQARAERLPLVVHTASSRDVADALDAGATGVEHGPRDRLSDDLLGRLKASRATYDPTLSAWEGYAHLLAGQTDLLDRSLVQQSALQPVLTATRAMLGSRTRQSDAAAAMRQLLALESENLKRAYEAGVTLVAGSDAGNPLVFHGATVQHELQLWVAAGIPPAAALQAATSNAARLLGAGSRMGRVAKGYEANLLIVDGNPLTDIGATERISLVVFKGERIRRASLFTENQNTSP